MKKLNKAPINQPKWLKFTAYLLYLLSFLWVPKFIKKKKFERRKRKAIKKANNLKAKNGGKYYVVQVERDFIVGTRRELRNINKRGEKVIKRLTKTNLLNFDYRNAIVYQTDTSSQTRDTGQK